MHKFEVGDRVVHIRVGECTFVEWDEGRCTIRNQTEKSRATYHNVRPSELTPADPVPDAAVMLADEWVVRYWKAVHPNIYPETSLAKCRAGGWRDAPMHECLVHYIRANQLTVEALDNHLLRLGIYINSKTVAALHAALTEQLK